jgi:hypothetical protein
MIGWTAQEKELAFHEYCGGDHLLDDGEWLNLCKQLNTSWKPHVPTVEEKCNNEFSSVAGTDGKMTWSEFDSNSPSEYMSGWTTQEKEIAFTTHAGSDA